MLLTAALALAATLHAQDFWVKKDWRQWSERECEKMLENSPWSKTVTVQAVSPLRRNEAVEVVGSGSTVGIQYKAQIRSARPIRQGMVRQSQLNTQSRKLSPEEQRALEERYRQLLEGQFSDRIIFVVNYSTIREMIGDVLAYWQSRAQEEWLRDAVLVTPAGRISPLEVNVPEGNRPQFQLIFPRALDGNPVIGPADQKFSLEFSQPTIRGVPGQRLIFEFRPKEMTLLGQLEL